MPNYRKVTFIFTQTTGEPGGPVAIVQRTGGWSETWYFDGTLEQCQTASARFAIRRAGMLTWYAAIVGYRIQEIGGRARVYGGITPGVLQSLQDIPQMALQLSVDGLGTNSRKYFQIRGIPDTIVEQGNYRPSRAFSAAVSLWGEDLAGAPWRFRAKAAPVAPPGVISINVAGEFLLNGPLNFNQGDFLTFKNMRNTVGQNVGGKYYVANKVNDRQGTLQAWGGTQVSLSGYVAVLNYTYPLVAGNSLNIGLITTRKVGRPFGQYRGRARK